MEKKKTNKIDKVYNLIGFFNEDKWDLTICGLREIQMILPTCNFNYGELDFSNIKNDVIKKEMKYYIFNQLNNYNKSYSNLRENYLRPYKWFINYLNIKSESINTLSSIGEEVICDYKSFLRSNNIIYNYRKYIDRTKTCNNTLATIPIKIMRFLIDKYNIVEGEDPDEWDLYSLNISSHRFNYSRAIRNLRFYCILNTKNKRYIKDYMKYLLYNTETSMEFVKGKLTSLKQFAAFTSQKNFDEIERKDIEEYKKYLLEKDIDESTFNVRLLDLSNFFTYGIEKKLWVQNHIYKEYDLFNIGLKIRGDTVESNVIEQIIDNKRCFTNRDFTMFLILYCCGMRISEVCLLKKDNIRKDEKGYYIVFYVQKMKKEAVNPIPENLYLHIMNYCKEVKGDYLFTGKDGRPVISNTYTETMKKIIRKLNIKNNDGTVYNFRPHEFRHTFATSLLEKDVPFTVIQKLLHHSSPEMSLVYAQITDSRKRKKYIEFINKVGMKSKALFDNEEENEKVYEVQWLKNNLKSQALPNGFCALPVSLGVCPYANACLTCDYFKSTKKHLPILEKQLVRTKALIEILEERNLSDQLKVNLEVKKNLETIINTIEEGD